METFIHKLLVFLLFNLIYTSYAANNGVPVLLWKDEGSNEFPSSLEGHTQDPSTVYSKFLEPQIKDKKHNILAFIQDELSVEDFTQHADVYNENSDGAVFHFLKDIMAKQPSTHVPSISSSSAVLEKLKEAFKGKTHVLKEPYSLKDISLNDDGNLVIVNLPSTKQGHVKRALTNIDGILGSVNKQMKELGKPFTALYTGAKSSEVAAEDVEIHHGGRHLLQEKAEQNNASFWNVSDGCLIVYIANFTFEVDSIDSDGNRKFLQGWQLPGSNTPEEDSTCSNGSAKLHVKYTTQLPADLTEFEFTMVFGSDKYYWNISSLEYTYTAKLTDGKEIKGTDRVAKRFLKLMFAPKRYSYHCTFQEPLRHRANASTAAAKKQEGDMGTGLKFYQLQTQLFGEARQEKFGQVNDCTGFFTLPIWSALISGALLIAILMFGLSLLSSITTQDRFDDPKGKTIQVNVSE